MVSSNWHRLLYREGEKALELQRKCFSGFGTGAALMLFRPVSLMQHFVRVIGLRL